MNNPQVAQLKEQKRILEKLASLQESPQWEVFEAWLKARHANVLPNTPFLKSEQHALEIASKLVYQQAIKDILLDLNALDASIQMLSQEIDKLT
jgi:hypothetical protein